MSDLTLITLTFGGADVEAARRLDAANLTSAIQALRWHSAHSLPERNDLGLSDFQVDALRFCGVKAKKKKKKCLRFWGSRLYIPGLNFFSSNIFDCLKESFYP